MNEVREKHQDEKYQKRLMLKWIICIAAIFFIYKGFQIIYPEKTIVYNRMKKHLKEKYGEEFVIIGLHKASRGDEEWYGTYSVYPERYIGTNKEFDKYYQSKAATDDKKFKVIDDGFTGVLAKESANEFYRPKLEELFGKNVVSAIILGGAPKYSDFEEEMSWRREHYQKWESEGDVPKTFSVIRGAIYIYGRVENESDREEYRKKIYEFIQYMKETETFDYVDLNIHVMDERELVDGILRVYSDIPSEIDDNDWRQLRKKRYEEFTESFNKMSLIEIEAKLTQLNLEDMKTKTTGTMLYLKLYSPKQIISNNWDDEKIKEYIDLKELEFTWEAW